MLNAIWSIFVNMFGDIYLGRTLLFQSVGDEYLPFGSVLIPITSFKHLRTPLPLKDDHLLVS